MFGGRGMRGGSGAGGGGGMLRNVGRAVTRVSVANANTAPKQLQECFSSSNAYSSSDSTTPTSRLTRKSKSSNPLSLSSSLSSHANHPVSAIPIWYSPPEAESDDYDWVSVDGVEDDTINGIVLGPVPSANEVEDAVSALQQVFGHATSAQLVRDKYCYKLDNDMDHVTITGFVNQDSSDGSEIDWAEPSLSSYNSKVLPVNGSDRVYYALHLLQTEPSVQRMVKSLSSDKAVWDAVLNNDVVRELRESFSADTEHVLQSPEWTSSSDSFTTTNIVMWIFGTVKAKFVKVIESITKIVNDLFQPADHKTAADEGGLDSFNEKLKTSFMLSIMVLLVVVVSRAHSQGMT